MVLQRGTLNLRVFLRSTEDLLNSGSRWCNLWFVSQHISSKSFVVKLSLRSYREIPYCRDNLLNCFPDHLGLSITLSLGHPAGNTKRLCGPYVERRLRDENPLPRNIKNNNYSYPLGRLIKVKILKYWEGKLKMLIKRKTSLKAILSWRPRIFPRYVSQLLRQM